MKNEPFSAKPEAVVNERLSDLNKEVFSAKPEAKPSEALRFMLRPLSNELARANESEKDLKNELF